MQRKATAADLETIASHRGAELDAKAQCRRLAADLKLDLKVVEARQAFDAPKLTITFFAEERADVRELQGKLGDRLGRRVELKQVSARDESRIVGGYGPCGRSLCCATFAGDQEPVSIRMAKDQNLPLNPTKITRVLRTPHVLPQVRAPGVRLVPQAGAKARSDRQDPRRGR